MNVTTIKLGVDSRDVKGARKELDGMQSAAKGAETATSKLGKALSIVGGIVGGISLAAMTRSLFDANKEFDRLNASLETVTGSAMGAENAFMQIQQFAKNTPYQLTQVTDAFIKLKAMGLDSSEKSLESYGNTASAMGKDLNQMIEAVADAATGEFERLKEFGIKARSEGENVSFTFQGTTETIGKNAAEITGYLKNIGLVNFAGGMERQMDTLGGKASNLSDAWDDFLKSLGDSGFTSQAKGILADFTTELGNMSGWVRENKDDVKRAFEIISTSVRGIGEAAQWSIEKTTKMGSWVADLSAAFGLAAAGTISFADIATANRDELREIVASFDLDPMLTKLKSQKESLEISISGLRDQLTKGKRGSFLFDIFEPDYLSGLENTLRDQLIQLGKVKKEIREITEKASEPSVDITKPIVTAATEQVSNNAAVTFSSIKSEIKKLAKESFDFEKFDTGIKLSDQLDEIRAATKPAYAAALELGDSLTKIFNIAEAGLIGEDEFDRLTKGFIKVANAAGGIGSKLESNAASMQEGLQMSQRLFDQQSKEFQAIEVAIQAANVARAIGAILNQAAFGDPFTAFARMATMAAAVASLGVSINSFTSGGESQNPNVYNTGSGTVLGSNDSSNSVENIASILEDAHALEYDRLTGIYSEVRDLNNNITGLVHGILVGGDFSQMESASGMKSYMAGIQDVFDVAFKNFEFLFAGLPIGDWLGSAAASVLGGKTDVSQLASGIQVTGATMGDVLSGAVTDVGDFFVDMKKVVDGGWFHSDDVSYWTITKDLDDQTNRLFSKVFVNLGNTILSLAEGFNMDITDELMSMSIDLGKIDLMGKTGDEVTKIITDAFSAYGDELVDTLFGSIVSQYQEVNEGLLETAVRLMADKEQVLRILDYTNKGLDTSVESAIELSESLIDVAGGLDALKESFSTYYDKFFSDSEKAIDEQDALTGALEGMGMALPGTRDGFKDLVESIDITTESGQRAYASLLALAGTANDYYSYLEKAQKDWVSTMENALSAVQNVRKTVDETARTTLLESIMGIRGIAASVAGGNASALDNLDMYLSGITGATESQYKKAEDYYLDQARATSALTHLENVIGDQLTTDEQILEASWVQHKESIEALNTINQSILGGPAGTLTGQSNNDTLISEVIELKSIVSEQAEQNRLLVKRISDTIDDWDGAGLPEARTA
jgi:uncharacterized protein YukE